MFRVLGTRDVFRVLGTRDVFRVLGTRKGHPYVIVDNDDTVYMIGHDLERAQFYMRPSFWQFLPFLPSNLPIFVQDHFLVFNMPENTAAVMCADRNKIRAFLAIIVTAQANTAPMM